jgi:putative SOS response-associated peptidase YedK
MVSVQQAIGNHAAEAPSSASTAGRWTIVLWDRWRSKDKSDTKETFTIITTAPSAFAAQWHDCMPLILEPDEWETWLQGDQTQLRR